MYTASRMQNTMQNCTNNTYFVINLLFQNVRKSSLGSLGVESPTAGPYSSDPAISQHRYFQACAAALFFPCFVTRVGGWRSRLPILALGRHSSDVRPRRQTGDLVKTRVALRSQCVWGPAASSFGSDRSVRFAVTIRKRNRSLVSLIIRTSPWPH